MTEAFQRTTGSTCEARLDEFDIGHCGLNDFLLVEHVLKYEPHIIHAHMYTDSNDTADEGHVLNQSIFEESSLVKEA